jgi:hypothetical protein
MMKEDCQTVAFSLTPYLRVSLRRPILMDFALIVKVGCGVLGEVVDAWQRC